jgi:hypothetical protein
MRPPGDRARRGPAPLPANPHSGPLRLTLCALASDVALVGLIGVLYAMPDTDRQPWCGLGLLTLGLIPLLAITSMTLSVKAIRRTERRSKAGVATTVLAVMLLLVVPLVLLPPLVLYLVTCDCTSP